jgi:integrase
MATLEFLTLDSIAALPTPPTGNLVYWASGVTVQGRPTPKGFGIRITARGARAFVLNYSLNGKEHRYTIGSTASWTVVEAVREARQLRQRIDRGEDIMSKPADKIEAKKTVAAVLDSFLDRTKIRRPDHYSSVFERFVKPALGQLPILELRRRHITELLDHIEDRHGPVMASRTLSYLRSACNWWAVRDDEFTPPFVAGMSRSSTSNRARDRILTDSEIRTLWPVFESAGNFGKACMLMLLTGSRRSEVTGMRWTELADGIWTVPAARYKSGKDHIVPLSVMAQEIIAGQDRTRSPLVFPGRQGASLSRGGNGKSKIDRAAPGLAHWRIHDLRRSARSLMSRAGVQPDIAERVLGHSIPGVRGVYDRHQFLSEKREALELLADTVRAIVDRS